MNLSVWLGASDTEIEGEWYWMDENDAKHNASSIQWNKDRKQPDGDKRENCLMLRMFGSNAKLHDGNCEDKRKFLCQRLQRGDN